MGGFSYGGFGDDEDELLPSRIARPTQQSAIPPVTLRGVGSGSTNELESEGLASHVSPRPISSPSPLEARTTADQNELVREQRTGSGISQIQHGSPEGGIGIAKPHPIAGGILRGLSTVGSVLAPGVMANIPGTEEHHNLVMHQQRGRIGEDLGEQKEEAATAETGARTEQASAAAEKDRADAAAKANPQPKEGLTPEEKTIHDLMTGENGQPRIDPQTQQPYTYLAAYQAVKQAGQDVKPTPEVKGEKTTRVVNGVPHEVLYDPKTGADIKDLGQTKVPGESPDAKRAANESAQVERESRQNIRKAETQYRATQQSVNQLNAGIDAAKDGNGLLTSFVPTMEVLGINASNGVHRISPAEAQAAGLPGGWTERFNAWFDKAATGQLSPQLQTEGKALAKILSDSAYQRYKSTYDDESGIVSGYGGTDFGKRVPLIQGGGGGNEHAAEPARPANVPANYVYQKSGPKGEGWYRP